MARPKLFISKCLGFANCRYDGAIIPNKFVEKLIQHCDYVTTCPEMKIGLGVPRKPIRIVKTADGNRLKQPATGNDFTEEMQEFTSDFLDGLEEVDGFILKYGSPSCGKNNVNVYYENLDKKPMKSAGFFGGAVLERFKGLALEDEGRLNNFAIRENFLTQLFTLARFRALEKKMSAIVEFHSNNKLLFMGYNQDLLKDMGHIVANKEHDVEEVFLRYREKLSEILSKDPDFRNWINVLQHAFGGLSKHLSKEEKKFFLDKVEEYRDERIPRSVLLGLIESWAVRFDNNYLLSQTFIRPFPNDLVDITDSGKGRK